MAKLSRWWLDFWLTLIVSSGLVFSLRRLFLTHILPLLSLPPNTLSSTCVSLKQQYDNICTKLEHVTSQADTQTTQTSNALDEVESFLRESREFEISQRRDVKRLEDALETLKNDLPRMLEANANEYKESLVEIRNELQSLSKLSSHSNHANETSEQILQKLVPSSKGLPAWQLEN